MRDVGLVLLILGHKNGALQFPALIFKTYALGGKAGGFGFSHIKPGVDRRKLFLHLAAGWRIWPLKEGEGEPE